MRAVSVAVGGVSVGGSVAVSVGTGEAASLGSGVSEGKTTSTCGKACTVTPAVGNIVGDPPQAASKPARQKHFTSSFINSGDYNLSRRKARLHLRIVTNGQTHFGHCA
jgi:hypothetical protein